MLTAIDSGSANEAVITMTRTLDAPRERVWGAFTDPKHVVRWYGGKGFENPVCEMDVRPGGHWRHVMRTPDGAEHALHFVFVEVVRPERLSWQAVAHGNVGGEPLPLSTVTLEEHGGRTKLRFVARFKTLAERDLAMSWGFSAVLAEGVDKMVALLTSMDRAAEEG